MNTTTIFYTLIMFFSIISMILVHEAGHFFMARKLGIPVAEFAVGFGPILYKKEKNGIRYSLRAIPLGGFCSFSKDDMVSDATLMSQPPLKRFLVLVAGPMMNIITGFLVALILKHFNLFEAFIFCIKTTKEIFHSFQMLFSGEAGLKDVYGIVGLSVEVGKLALKNIQYLPVSFILVSIYLGLFNLLPIPMLDGGSVFMCIYEFVTGKRTILPTKATNVIKTAFFACLMTLSFGIIVLDIVKLLIV